MMNTNRWRDKPNNNSDNRRPSSRERPSGGWYQNSRRSPSRANGSRERSPVRRNNRKRFSPEKSPVPRDSSPGQINGSNPNRSPSRYNSSRVRSPVRRSQNFHNNDRRDGNTRKRSPVRFNQNHSPKRTRRPASRSHSPHNLDNEPKKDNVRQNVSRSFSPDKKNTVTQNTSANHDNTKHSFSPKKSSSNLSFDNSLKNSRAIVNSKNGYSLSRSPQPPLKHTKPNKPEPLSTQLQKEFDFSFMPRISRLRFNFSEPTPVSGKSISSISDKKFDPSASILASELGPSVRGNPNLSGYSRFEKTSRPLPQKIFPSLYQFPPLSAYKTIKNKKEPSKAIFISCYSVTSTVREAIKNNDKSVQIKEIEAHKPILAETVWGFDEPITSCSEFQAESFSNYLKGLNCLRSSDKGAWHEGTIYVLKSVLFEAQSLEALRFLNQPVKETLHRYESSLESMQKLRDTLCQYSLYPDVKSLFNLIIASLCYTIIVFWRLDPSIDLNSSRTTPWYLETASAALEKYLAQLTVPRVKKLYNRTQEAFELGSLTYPLPTLYAPGLTNAIKFARSLLDDGLQYIK